MTSTLLPITFLGFFLSTLTWSSVICSMERESDNVILLSRTSVKVGREIASVASLIEIFLSNHFRFKKVLTRFLNNDAKRLLARFILRNHPLVKKIGANLEKYLNIHTFQDHSHSVNSAEFNRFGNRVVTTSRDKTAKIWDMNSGTCIRTIQGHDDCVVSAQFNSAGNRIVTASGIIQQRSGM